MVIVVCLFPGLQLLGDPQTLLSDDVAVPPVTESHDTTAAISLVEREGGDFPDDVIIDSMVAAVTSSGDEDGEEEGEIEDEESGMMS